MVWACQNGSRKDSKGVAGRQNTRREKTKEDLGYGGLMMDVELDLEEYRCKKIENKSFRQRRMGIFLYGSRTQTYRAVVLKKSKKKMLARDYVNVK